jgi:hypothetical protein
VQSGDLASRYDARFPGLGWHSASAIPRLHRGQLRQLLKRPSEALRLDEIGLVKFAEQSGCRRAEGSTQLFGRKASNERVLQPAGYRDRQAVGSLGVGGGQTKAEACERQQLIPDAADPVLGLPGPAALDAGSSMQDVMPRKPYEVSGVERGGLGLLDRLAEDSLEVRTAGAELSGGSESEVDLEARR